MGPAHDVRTVPLPSGEHVPALGQGTWGWAQDPGRRASEKESLLLGLDLGMTLVDTAEMYGQGAAEELVGETLAGRRDEAFLVTKVLPYNAGRMDTVNACERSLKRLRTDRIDLYLLHWRGAVPLEETVDAFDELLRAGKIRHWGVSNFDPADLRELAGVPGGDAMATNQVLYNLTRRGIEYDLLPHCHENGIPVMAYSPVEQGRLLPAPALEAVARRHDATSAQVALAWVLRRNDVIAIPRAGRTEHVRENRAALSLTLTDDDLAALDDAFPPVRGPVPLEVL
ncbi:aldo/keto reductase [Streptomyces sp. NPDC057307]|uniref:aldo/keto reductase n=1 Tax=Streptomyces sp. NPDC057307 TaxID=3346096 RepID=UPI00362A29AD